MNMPASQLPFWQVGWTANSLRAKLADLRNTATELRAQHSLGATWYGPAMYVADAYDRAADSLQDRLDALPADK